MSINVKIPAPLRPLTAGKAEIAVDAATVAEVLRKLDVQHAGFQNQLLDTDGSVKRFINIYVNDENIRDSQNLETRLKSGDTISILPSIAGGVSSGRWSVVGVRSEC